MGPMVCLVFQYVYLNIIVKLTKIKLHYISCNFFVFEPL